MTSPSSAAAFDALAIVVRDRGLDIADDPGRLRGMLNDVLAADARVNRGAVDALVLAAEQGVPRELSSTPVPDEARLIARLTGRGVSPELAGQTVRAWIVAAQGGRTAQPPAAPTEPPPGALAPPPPPPPPPPTALPAPPAPPVGPTAVPLAGSTVLPIGGDTFESTAPSADEAAIATGARPAIEPVLVPPPPPGPPAGAKGEGRLPRRTVVLLIAAVVAAIALIGGVLALGGGDDDAASPTTLPPTTSTSTSTSTTAPGEPLLEVLAPAAGTEATAANSELSGRVEPGSSVTVDGTAVTVDAAGNWKQPVALPGAETTFSIVVTTPTGTTKTVAWVVKRDVVAPVLDITDPVDGTVLNTREVLLHGTTERNATVTVDGVGAAPDTATTTDTVLGWVSGVLINGDQQTYTVTSTDPAGNVQTKTVTLRFQASAPPPSPPTTPRVPRPPTASTTTVAPPPPAPTLIAVSDDAGSWNFQSGSVISFNVVGNDSGEWTDIEFGGLSGGYGTLERLSGGFFRYTMRDAGNWTETFSYRLRNSATGATSNWASVTFHIVCSC